MLRASSETHAESVDLNVVMSGEFAGDVPHGRELVALAEAVVSSSPDSCGSVISRSSVGSGTPNVRVRPVT